MAGKYEKHWKWAVENQDNKIARIFLHFAKQYVFTDNKFIASCLDDCAKEIEYEWSQNVREQPTS